MKSKLSFLFDRVDGASLALFRAYFGLCMLIEVIRYWPRIAKDYINPSFHFSYDFFSFVTPWSGEGMYLHFIVMGVAATGIMIGLWYRLSAVVFFLSVTYFFLLEQAKYLNHMYLICLISFLLIFLSADNVASLRGSKRPREQTIPFWNILVLRAQIVIVYFFAGVAKLNPDWLAGEPMRRWLFGRITTHAAAPFLTQEWVVQGFVYGGLLFDLSIGFLLLWKRTRRIAVIPVLAFHLTNEYLFTIGIFPTLMIGTTVLFLGPSWARALLARLRGRSQETGATLVQHHGPFRWVVVCGLLSYFAIQIFMPLRHWFYPGDVAWTEEGHKYSWRMKLRTKKGKLKILIVDSRTGERVEVKHLPNLTPRQRRKMMTRPNMLFEYIHHLRDQLVAAGVENPEIYVENWVSLNGRAYAPLIDPTVNLAEAHYSPIFHDDWILHLDKDLPIGVYPSWKPPEQRY